MPLRSPLRLAFAARVVTASSAATCAPGPLGGLHKEPAAALRRSPTRCRSGCSHSARRIHFRPRIVFPKVSTSTSAARYGVRRADPRFWATSDRLRAEAQP
jgi:hypothetical protein